MTKQIQNSNSKAQNKEKRYDLEERTLEFFRKVIRLCKKLPKDAVNIEIIRQLIRAAGSIGANYREANEAISKKDFGHRIKLCRKEAKESHFWLQGLLEANSSLNDDIRPLIQEALELTMIFSSIKSKVS